MPEFIVQDDVIGQWWFVPDQGRVRCIYIGTSSMMEYQAIIAFLGWMASSMVWEVAETSTQTESCLPPVNEDGSTQTEMMVKSFGLQVDVATCALVDASSQLSLVRPRMESVVVQSTEPVMLLNSWELRFMGQRQVTGFHFVSLQMSLSLWEYFEEMSRRYMNRYVGAIGNQRCAFIENDRRHADTVIGASHLYAEAVYAVYRFSFQFKHLGFTRPTVRRNCDIPIFRSDVRLWDQPPRAQ